MFDYLKSNFIAFLALIVSAASFLLSFKNHLKSVVKLKLSYDIKDSFSVGLMHYDPYKLLIVNLKIENLSTSDVNISKVNVMSGSTIHTAQIFNITDYRNSNGISLIKKDHSRYIPVDIISDNILNDTRIPSYGVIQGYAVFNGIEPKAEATEYKVIVETPGKKFSKKIIIDPLDSEYAPINPLPINA